jgi:hypothetical protein
MATGGQKSSNPKHAKNIKKHNETDQLGTVFVFFFTV